MLGDSTAVWIVSELDGLRQSGCDFSVENFVSGALLFDLRKVDPKIELDGWPNVVKPRLWNRQSVWV